MKLIDYIKGNRHGKEANQLERQAMDDAFLQEAIDGYDTVKGDHADSISRLQKKISTIKPTQNRRKLLVAFSLAASILLLVTVGSLYFMHKKIKQNSELAKVDSEKKEVKRIYVDNKSFAEKKVTMENDKSTSPIISTSAEILEPEITIEDNNIMSQEINNAKTEDITATENDFKIKDEKETKITDDKANTKKLHGKVIDKNGESLIGANVKVKGSKNNTITNINGEFELALTDTSATKLVVSHIGYEKKEVKVSDKDMIIAMNEDTKLMDEVVVIGYGTREREDFTGAITQKSIVILFDEDKFMKYVQNKAKKHLCGAEKDTVTVQFSINEESRPDNIDFIQSSCQKAKNEIFRLLDNSPDWVVTEKTITMTLVW